MRGVLEPHQPLAGRVHEFGVSLNRRGATLLINNAGSSTGANLLYGEPAKIRLEMDTHFFGTLSVVRAFAPEIAANGDGTILNISPYWVSFPQVGAYCAAKSAEWSMTNALRAQLAGQHIRVVGLHVGYMDTDMAASMTAPKADPAHIAAIAIDGIEHDLREILADETSRQVQAPLAGGVPALYPRAGHNLSAHWWPTRSGLPADFVPAH